MDKVFDRLLRTMSHSTLPAFLPHLAAVTGKITDVAYVYLSSCSAAVTDVGGEVYAVRLGCPASSSARPHDSPRVARLDGQGVSSLDGYGDGGVDRVGEGVMGGG